MPEFYVLASTANQKETGAYPQIEIDFKKVKAMGNKDYKLIKSSSFTEKAPDLSPFVFNKGAKITDILSSTDLTKSTGLFMNYKVKETVLSASLNACRFYPLSLTYKVNAFQYFFCHIISDESLINFNESFFANFRTPEERIAVISSSDVRKKSREQRIVIRPQKIVLNQTVDLFRLPINTEIYISRKLKNALEENNITGMKIEPTKVQFEIS